MDQYKFFTEDGRRAQKVIYDSDAERVIEVCEEEEKPLVLRKRIIEKKENIVTERKVETIQDGEVVDVQTESIYPQAKMELREHLSLTSTHLDKVANPYATKEDLVETVVAATKSVVDSLQLNASVNTPSVPQYKSSNKSIAELESVVGTNLEKKNNALNWGLTILIALLVSAIGAALIL